MLAAAGVAPVGSAPAGASAAPPAARGAVGQQAAGGGSILGGLKQQLLAYLFREAQRQSAEAAASSAGGAEPPAASEPQPHGLGGLGGSTASLLSAVAPTQPRGFTSLVRQGSSASSLRGLGGSTSSLGGLGSGDASQQPHSAAHPHWRRPLDRFHYYFEAYAEMLMWKVGWPTRGIACRRARRAASRMWQEGGSLPSLLGSTGMRLAMLPVMAGPHAGDQTHTPDALPPRRPSCWMTSAC